jgi:parallel beta-helix repeat protein
MKETVVATLILVCLMALGVVCVMPVKAQPYQGGITINADGSVSPSTALIQRTGDTYTLTGNLNITASNIGGDIIVQRNNTVLDGNRHIVGQILLSHVSNVTVRNFIVPITAYSHLPRGYFGITLEDSSNVTVANNSLQEIRGIYQAVGDVYAGIYVEGGSSNTIVGNNLVNNAYGIYFSGTENSLIVENTLFGEGGGVYSGIVLEHAFNNAIYHNNFMLRVFSAIQAGVSNSSNVWDIGYPGGGNYWSNYQKRYPNATEIDSSGIGDTSYVIDGQNIDRYPLMEAFNSTFFELQTTPPKISIRSPKNQAYNESSVLLDFSVNVVSAVKAVNWTGYSLDGNQNVTITGNTTLTGLSSGLHNVTVYANDTYGNMAASETVTFTIPQPFPVVPVAATSVIVAVVVVGLLVYFKKRKR